jgi:hypothetical protein
MAVIVGYKGGFGSSNGPMDAKCKTKFVFEDNVIAFTSAMPVNVQGFNGEAIFRRNTFMVNTGAPMYNSLMRLGGNFKARHPTWDRHKGKFIVDQNVFMDTTSIDCQCCDLVATNNVFLRQHSGPAMKLGNQP